MYMTNQRKWLFQFFNDHPDCSFSAKEILEKMNQDETAAVSLSAVYRNLASLAEAGLILKSASVEGQETKYRYVGAEACQHELHMTCLCCGKTSHVDHGTAESLNKALQTTTPFRLHYE